MEAKKKAAEQKKADASAAVEALHAAWATCGEVCTCERVPCPVAGLKKCATCGDIKSRLCIKKACVAARKPLALTYTGP